MNKLANDSFRVLLPHKVNLMAASGSFQGLCERIAYQDNHDDVVDERKSFWQLIVSLLAS